MLMIGDSLMKGYWRNAPATNEIFVEQSDGRWMRTGDIAYVNNKGYFFIVDRMKELIKVKGNQVAPAELEALLLEHPAVQDACVVGVVIKGEEVPRAYVVPQQGKGGGELEGEIQKWFRERTSRFKWLVGGIWFVEAIPKNPVCLLPFLLLAVPANETKSGKILRKIMREKAKAEVGDKDHVQAKL
jgi:4-coumarate--CoA ligase